jgi:hypothetical protein
MSIYDKYQFTTGKLLKVLADLHGESETTFIFELPNGELLRGWDMIGKSGVQKIKPFVGKTPRFDCHPFSLGPKYEVIAEPRMWIESNLTPMKPMYFYRFITRDMALDPLGITEFTIPNEHADTLYIGPLRGVMEEDQITIFYGVLKKIPEIDELLLDTGMGAFFIEDLPTGLAAGDHVKCTVRRPLRMFGNFALIDTVPTQIDTK